MKFIKRILSNIRDKKRTFLSKRVSKSQKKDDAIKKVYPHTKKTTTFQNSGQEEYGNSSPTKPRPLRTTGVVAYKPSIESFGTNAKMKVEIAKFEAGNSTSCARARRKEITLPLAYGDNRIIAMTRDPWWIYTYWDIMPQREEEINSQMERDGNIYECSILRVYDITDVKDFNGTNANSFFDIRLKGMAQNWYIEVARPNREWCIDIGLLSKSNRFYTLARSNFVHTPRFGMSEIMDEEWMCPEEDYWQLFGLSGGFGIGKSSMEMKEIFQKYFKEWVSSGAISSFSSFVLANKGQ